ncbi:ATP-binding protein [Aeromonas salmonicida]|uniref:ATP-binding protein n=1 Tax=Aeromonas salmonicida TaxID=645 RepID=UPI003D3230EB
MSNDSGSPQLPLNESGRLAALLAFELLDTPAEAMFDNITMLAAQICNTPIALISLVDAERQWFKSRVGLSVSETPRELAFCAHAINDDELFEIENALLDPRFRDNPLVTSDPDIRFYAGMPLSDGHGHNLGTLCVIDRQPRQLNEQQRQSLKLLAQQTVQLFELRQQSRHQREQAALHKAILGSVANIVLVVDPAGIIQQVSPGVTILLGYPTDELLGREFELLLPRTRRQQPSNWLSLKAAQSISQGQLHEEQLRHASGHTVPVLLNLSQISFEDDFDLGYLCVVHDLSYREEIVQRLQLLSTQLPGVVYQFQLFDDGRSCFPYASQGIEYIYGLTPEAVMKDATAVYALIDPDDLQRISDSIATSAANLELWHQEYRVLHPTKGLIWVEGRAVPQRGADGSVIWHGFISDITERKHLERLKDEFVSTVSHELRTPLTSITGSLGLINGGALGMVPDSIKDMLAIAEGNSRRLRQLIDDLLDMDKLIAGKMSFDLQPIKLDELLAECDASHQGFAQHLGVRLVHSNCPDLQVLADAQRLQQVLSNLLSNALKFSPAHGEVRLYSELEGQSVRILVSDQGPGIPADFTARIFKKFSQADASDSRQKGGTGLGLAISKELIERMGGTIGFVSESQRGSTFWIELPLHHQEDEL